MWSRRLVWLTVVLLVETVALIGLTLFALVR